MRASFETRDDRPTLPVASDGRVERLRDRVSKGDWGGALLLAETLLVDHPDSPEAESARRICRSRLLEGAGALDLSGVPRLTMSMDRICDLPLDNRAGFLLSLIDGRCTVEHLIDVSGLASVEVVEILGMLVEAGVLSVR